MRTLRSAGLIVSLAMLCGPTTSLAQVAGTISGYVQDQGGGAMPGATVTVESAGQQLVRTTVTNPTGFFDLQALPRGVYQIKVEMTGFDTQVQKNIEVTAGANVRVDFSMRVGGLSEESRRHGSHEPRRNAQRHAVQPDRRSARAGSSDERPQRRRARGHLRRRHVNPRAAGHVRRPPGTGHVRQWRQHESQPVHPEWLGVHALQPDDRVQSAAARRGAGNPDPDAQLHCRVRSYGRQSGQYRVQGRYQQLPRNGMGVPSQRGAERADLLPDAKAGAEAKPGGGQRPVARSSRTSCSGSARTSGSGIAREAGSSRPSCRPRRNGSAISPLSARSCGIR